MTIQISEENCLPLNSCFLSSNCEIKVQAVEEEFVLKGDLWSMFLKGTSFMQRRSLSTNREINK